jgi:cytoskeletal protein CcmA (bactofilin family)
MSMQNISIMGEGCISSGNYKTVRVMGEGKILGYIEVGKLSIMGTLESESDLKVGKLSISGEGKFSSINAENISIMGNGKFDGAVKTNYIKIMGEAEIKDNMKAQEIIIMGSLEGKSVESETFVSNGSFELESLNANDIKVKLRGPCKGLEIGGETINVKYPRVGKIFLDVVDILLFRKTKRAELNAETIEADSIYLENTVAKSVKGNNIIIGPGCKIKSIEYKETLYIDNSSMVEKSLQV